MNFDCPAGVWSLALLTRVYSGAALKQDAAVQVGVKGCNDLPPEFAVSLFEEIFPAPLTLVRVEPVAEA